MAIANFHFSTQHPVNEPDSPNHETPDKPVVSAHELSFELDVPAGHIVDHADSTRKVSVDVILETGPERQTLEDIVTTHDVI